MASDFEKIRVCTILIAEDDPDDRLIIKAAFDATGVLNPLHFVGDGEELMDYLKKDRNFGKKSPPHVLILDLNMPKKDGRRALWEIRQDPILRNLTVIVLTTSNAEQDFEYCSKLGISDFITKPNNFDGFLQLAKGINQLSGAS
jgi:two-component system, response regulator